MSRKPYKPSKKIGGGLLTHMRRVAFGPETHFAIKDTMDRAERMRDDDKLLSDADAKRLRKRANRIK